MSVVKCGVSGTALIIVSDWQGERLREEVTLGGEPRVLKAARIGRSWERSVYFGVGVDVGDLILQFGRRTTGARQGCAALNFPWGLCIIVARRIF